MSFETENLTLKRRGEQMVYSKIVTFEGDNAAEGLERWKNDLSSVWNKDSIKWQL